MKLDHIPLNHLKPCPQNVRRHRSEEDGTLKASIRSLGVLQPLLVRPNCEGFEIVAGQRRFDACLALDAEGESLGPVPCAIIEAGDDATAIEASLAENIARLPMDEIDQYKAFAALIAEGRSAEDIAAAFGVTERLVAQRLALANLYGPILNAYRRDEIEPATLRLLTMASTRQQRAWWKLFRDEDEWAPTGHALKSWLFGGEHIPVGHALFDLTDYPGAIVSDLFSEERYFGDPTPFWEHQSRAIAALAERYRAEGWAEVVLHEAGAHFPRWDYAPVSREDGGEVHITCTADGEVELHEGLLPRKEVERRQRQVDKGDAEPATSGRPEATKALQNYLALHRHNAVRLELLKQPAVALRLMLAHAIAGSALWQVKVEPQRTANAAIDESIAASPAQDTFNAETIHIRHLLGIEDGGDVVDARPYGGRSLAAIFARLSALPDADVMRILAYVMAETLEAGTGFVEALGQMLAVDMREHWQPDDCFVDHLRDKPVINAMLAELAGETAAAGNVTATAKVQKGILKDCLNGTRKPVTENWLPRYMVFPMQPYTARGGLDAITKWQAVEGYFAG